MDEQHDSTATIIRSTGELIDLLRESATDARTTVQHARRAIDSSRETLRQVDELTRYRSERP